MKLEHDISSVRTTHPFVIARGGTSDHRLLRVRITDGDGIEGWGEAARIGFTARRSIPRSPRSRD